ncbi:MAG: hypothetical protein HY392_05095 [Candidatus Diapherotrites archaeon]|nr:hypothetical protein [Candidatus Diapherotrites archaeon]
MNKIRSFAIYQATISVQKLMSPAIVFLVDYSGKKDQQKTVNTIKIMMPEYKKLVEELSKKQD